MSKIFMLLSKIVIAPSYVFNAIIDLNIWKACFNDIKIGIIFYYNYWDTTLLDLNKY